MNKDNDKEKTYPEKKKKKKKKKPSGCTRRAGAWARRSSTPFASVTVPLWALRASCSAASACVPCSDSICLARGPGGALYGTGLARMADSLPRHYVWHIALLECQ